MIDLLAYAQAGDNGVGSLRFMLAAIAIVAALCIAAAALVMLGRQRKSSLNQAASVLMVAWTIVAGASALSFTSARMKWSAEQNTRIMSGYFDPRDESDKPPVPWVLWGILIGAYVVVLGMVLLGKRQSADSGAQTA